MTNTSLLKAATIAEGSQSGAAAYRGSSAKWATPFASPRLIGTENPYTYLPRGF